MTNKSCPLCGVIFQNDGEMCETCSAMMGGINSAPPTVLETNAPPTAGFAPVFQTNSQTVDAPVGDVNSFQSNYAAGNGFQPHYAANNDFQSNYANNNVQPDYAANNNFQSNYQQAPQFAPPVGNSYHYSPPPRRETIVPRVEEEYKPSIWNWITELPTFVKIGGVVLIFSICFAVALKGFMQMDVSVVNTAATNTEPQKPWFSSWFRSNPTAEEVLEKHEAVTYAKGKNLLSEGFMISGKAQIINVSGGGLDLVKLKKNPDEPFKPDIKISPATPLNGKTQPGFPGRTDFDVTFDLSIKAPNKLVTQMLLKPKEGFTQSYVAYKTGGFDGAKGWHFTKTMMMGKENINEEPNRSNDFYFNHTDKGVLLAIQKSGYSKIEFAGEEVVYNRRAYKIKTTNLAGENAEIAFDIETGLAVKVRQNSNDFHILDYSNFDGVLHPSKIVVSMYGEVFLLSIDKIQSDVPLDDSIFLRSSYK